MVGLRFLAPMAAGLVLSLQAQTIRVEAREVLVDVTVTGRGASIGDLAANDFSIWEDGKLQKINSVANAGADPEASQKHFVLFFDFKTMSPSDQAASKEYAARFVEAMSSPDRYMAVVSLTAPGSPILQNFTTARAALIKAIELPSSSSVVNGRQPGFFNPQQAGVTASDELALSLKAAADSMAPAPGRKAMLLFTGGDAGGPATSAVNAAISACNRANVAIYVIAGHPVAAGGDADSRYRRSDSLTNLHPNLANRDKPVTWGFLAEATGGESLALSTALPIRMAAIAREQDEYYRVSYTPPPSNDGICHTLRVKMNIRGLGTRARNEYCTEKPVDLVAGRIAGQALDSRTAGASGGTLGATMQLPYFYTGTNRASVQLSLEVVPAGMKFQKDQAGMHGQIDLVGTASRPDGATAARFADTVNIDVENRQRADEFTRAPYRYQRQFTVAAGKYLFSVAIGAGPNAVGKVEMPLEVDPWNAASFGIGGIAFSTEARPVDVASEGSGPILEGRTPLVAGGRRFVPASTSRFKRSDQLYFYTEVYDPALEGGSPSALTMEYRVLDRKTGEVKQDTGMAGVASYVSPGDPRVPFATRVPVAQLPAGSYRLEVRAGHTLGGETVARTADFDLN